MKERKRALELYALLSCRFEQRVEVFLKRRFTSVGGEWKMHLSNPTTRSLSIPPVLNQTGCLGTHTGFLKRLLEEQEDLHFKRHTR